MASKSTAVSKQLKQTLSNLTNQIKKLSQIHGDLPLPAIELKLLLPKTFNQQIKRIHGRNLHSYTTSINHLSASIANQNFKPVHEWSRLQPLIRLLIVKL